jgi:decaprenyl-phosphate phosphoribosyltransferase
MVSAFFLASKRFAELRSIGDSSRAARYRGSFKWYDEERLLVSITVYLVAAGLFAGVFLVRYRLELILCAPLVAAFVAHCMQLCLREDSPVLTPERLYRDRRFVVYLVGVVGLFAALMYTEIPLLYVLFDVHAAHFAPLWRIG